MRYIFYIINWFVVQWAFIEKIYFTFLYIYEYNFLLKSLRMFILCTSCKECIRKDSLRYCAKLFQALFSKFLTRYKYCCRFWPSLSALQNKLGHENQQHRQLVLGLFNVISIFIIFVCYILYKTCWTVGSEDT